MVKLVQKNKLFEPVNVGYNFLKNRVGVAPMTRTSATPEGLATEQMAEYYASFARGGFGFVITEGTYTDQLYSQCYFNQPGLINEEQAIAWKKVVDTVHEADAAIIVQLEHAGALSQGNRFSSHNLAPSKVQPKGDPLAFYGGVDKFPTPIAATKQDIEQVIQGFVESAIRAKAVGFDGVEIHGANGYLLDQFLTDYTNERSDEYGGSTENRVRLLIEVSSAVRKAVGPNFTVGIRISQAKVNDYIHKWGGGEADAKVIFGGLGQTGLDYIHVTEYKAWKPAFEENGPSLVQLAKRFSGKIVIANGQLEDPLKASEIITDDKADLVTLGKGALANHDWVTKVKEGKLLAEMREDKILRPDATIKNFEIL
ncbi:MULTISPECIES: NADH:flavin oxidoreductase [Paenibacillus]|uniref:NADH:flavin oxidoreductase n=1 Tax=Paenibacillus TaxID=44249 RepID=UPI00096C851A|nr:NADH:flavin oxidoreductase [Paenibacillus amylolyticus]OMF42089.1 NADH:flavin oxidoreductase [Paenibacillus amylolyticus]